MFGSEWFRSPTGFATHGELMVIIELHANMALVDADDNLVAQIGTNRAVCDVEGWPNVKNERGETNSQQPARGRQAKQPPRRGNGRRRQHLRIGVASRRPVHQASQGLNGRTVCVPSSLAVGMYPICGTLEPRADGGAKWPRPK